MERIYTVALKLNNSISQPVFETNLQDYLLSLGLFVPEKTSIDGISGTLLSTRHKDGNPISLDWFSVHIGSVGYVEELEAVKSAITIANQLESATPQFKPPLTFNPNLVLLFVGQDSEGNNITYEDFISNAVKLQKILYGGGNTAYYTSSRDFNVFLGLTKMFYEHSPEAVIKVGGRARRAASLDDLLTRLEQNQSSQ